MRSAPSCHYLLTTVRELRFVRLKNFLTAREKCVDIRERRVIKGKPGRKVSKTEERNELNCRRRAGIILLKRINVRLGFDEQSTAPRKGGLNCRRDICTLSRVAAAFFADLSRRAAWLDSLDFC